MSEELTDFFEPVNCPKCSASFNLSDDVTREWTTDGEYYPIVHLANGMIRRDCDEAEIKCPTCGQALTVQFAVLGKLYVSLKESESNK